MVKDDPSPVNTRKRTGIDLRRSIHKGEKQSNELKATLKNRHVTMIGLGGTIGAGLFIGIAEPLSTVGPLGTMISYGLSGLVMLATMMCLGELSTTFPHAGSFQYYAKVLFKNTFLSYTISWMYWLSWVFSIAAGLIAGGIVATQLFPGMMPLWVWCTIFLAFLTLLNTFSANVFGECEFWLAIVKVFAIVFFIVCGLWLILGRMETGWTPTFRVEGELFPFGMTAIFSSLAVVVYSFQGAEILGNVASETSQPEKALPSVIRSIGLRIVLFYVLAVGVLALLNPSGITGESSGPFVDVFKEAGLPWAEQFMQIVILSAALSAANSGIYVCSRMIWSMAETGSAPAYFGVLSKRSIPLRGVMLCAGLSLVSLLSKTFDAQRLFVFLIASTAQVGCVAWITIAACHLRYRQLLKRGKLVPSVHTWKAPGGSLLPILVIIANVAVILGGWAYDDTGDMIRAEASLFMFIVGTYFLFYEKGRNQFANLIREFGHSTDLRSMVK